MHIKTADKLADRYASLNLQKKTIEAELKIISAELLELLPIGDAVVTPEYRLSRYEGKESFSLIGTDDQKHKLQNELVKAGAAEFKKGNPFVQIRFLKSVAED